MTDQQATDDRVPMTLEELKIGKALLPGSRAAESLAVFVLLGEKYRGDRT
jgi:hypothetical protein